MALTFGAAACSGTSSTPSSGGASSPPSGISSSGSSASGSVSGSSAAGSSAPPSSAVPSSEPSSASPSAPSSASQPPSAPAVRVAAVHYEGGFAANQLALTPPEVVVYSDGTVVVSATKRSTLPPAVLTSLLSTVRKDLDGLPATVNPANGRTIPDIPTTVLGIRKADGSYQTVRASGLQQLGQEGGYPAPLYDAFTRLHGLTTAPSTPYSASGVRYQLQCPAAATTTPQPWPSAIPQPINGDGPSCTEIHLGGGATVAAVRTACVPLVQTDPQAKPAVPYRSDKGVRTCQWRYALPDENNS